MEWNTFVDDAKDMGTSIFETFSSAFNNAMGELLYTAWLWPTQPTPFNLPSLTRLDDKPMWLLPTLFQITYLPTFHQIASQEEIVQRMNTGLNAIFALKTIAKRALGV